jgi:hypothetical protein
VGSRIYRGVMTNRQTGHKAIVDRDAVRFSFNRASKLRGEMSNRSETYAKAENVTQQRF